MAHPARRRAENASGDFYVDSTCIDCDACRALAPDFFARRGDQSAVHLQPVTAAERVSASRALLACPTASIGCDGPNPSLAEARDSFPISVEEPVYYCGYHAAASFGAASYFIRRPEGNVLVDSPRRAAALESRLEALGGVRYLFLTHGDDVAEHAHYRERFGCERILHAGDLTSGTRDVERVLRGKEGVDLAPDLKLIPVPGHTRGSVALLFADTFLFTGDHLAFSERRGHLYAFRDACWFSWEEQRESMKRLSAYSFEWVLPGHGRRFHAPKAVMREQMQKCVEWMGRA